ncbi:serine protease [Actinotalea sp. K2]|uniref:trypsin-like serine peptidase n=1 Tax=Actinotalea sp. K2 TaxID=2939438 RepID=UPI00201799AF|nr:trypsin-like peptidase domain-containing protein [Actinotalea sp. K2]MCL3862424.1 hypothetical protein [Actinotalea sp. K2]
MATKQRKNTDESSSRSTKDVSGVQGFDRADALYPPHTDLFTFTAKVMEGPGPEYAMILESICGVADDSQPVEQYDGTLGVTVAFVAAHQRQAAQVQWNAGLGATYTNPGNVSGVRWGSGTMISRDLFLTCGHLFDQNPNGWTVPRQNGTATAISPAEIATNMRVNFLYQVDPSGTLRAEESYPITQLVEYRLGGLDMAICRLGGNPGDVHGWTEVSAANAAVGDMICIIGHPAGMPKRLEAGPATTVTTNRITYDDIDTLGGNSGSGILQASTGRIVGVHTNGGCTSTGGANSGVAIAGILAVSPTLQALPAGSSTGRAADGITTRFADDLRATIRAADTISLRDRIGTPLAADIGTIHAADTARVLDRPGTPLGADTHHVLDNLGTSIAGDIGTFGVGDDPDLTRVETAFDPGSFVDPRVFPQGGRPFVQAGPSQVVAREEVGAEGSDVLAGLEHAILAQRAALEALEATYESLAAQLEGGW